MRVFCILFHDRQGGFSLFSGISSLLMDRFLKFEILNSLELPRRHFGIIQNDREVRIFDFRHARPIFK